ncbi:MAG: RNA polymerase factor sigma-54 [Deltaproteobacteria bacterium]|nr:RNA polymerase factor sigma-54 [Deltaproteobacteria bacterium]MBW2218711.1 RNA polymerase factor sigma-54 [Deltaproteobacteria bacterium]
MVLELRQQLKLTQQLIMTPQLQMAIKLLQLSKLELVDVIQQEMEKNPALEEVQDFEPDEILEKKQDSATNSESEVQDVKIEEKIKEDIDWSNYIDEYNSPGRTFYETERREAPAYETFIAEKKSLKDHLLWQFLMTLPNEEDELIASQIIGNIDKDGYLGVSLEEIVQQTDSAPEKVEEVITLIQTFDPPGVCARDLSESLIIQASQLGITDSNVINIIKHHIKNLENKNYKAIAKDLKININKVVAAVNIITMLDPKPGRQYSDEEPQYITPDIYVHEYEDEFVILLNDDGMPKLRINPYYKKAIRNNEKIKGETREYLQDKMRSAAWLIRSIHQRQKTIYMVMESILKFQHDFFEKGIAYLKPMVLRDVAEDIEMHESTVSRVTTNKYAYTPQGIFELKYFFNSSIKRVHGDAIASTSVQDKIKKIIDSENTKKPYSDEKIAQLLKEVNISIARRTVAKYREMLGVLSSNKRKQF